MKSTALPRSVLLYEVDGLAEEVRPAVGDVFVCDPAMHVHRAGSIVDSLLGLARRVVRCHFHLGDPLELAAPVVPVLVYNSDAVLVEPEDRGIHPGLFAYLERLHHLVVGEVFSQQGGDVNQISGVGESAYEIAAGEYSADREVADFAHRHTFGRAAGRRAFLTSPQAALSLQGSKPEQRPGKR